jgi:hypothetical protein
VLGVRLLLRGGHAYHTLHHACCISACTRARTAMRVYTAGDRLRQDSELAAANSTGVKMKSLDSDDFLIATCLHLPIR